MFKSPCCHLRLPSSCASMHIMQIIFCVFPPCPLCSLKILVFLHPPAYQSCGIVIVLKRGVLFLCLCQFAAPILTFCVRWGIAMDEQYFFWERLAASLWLRSKCGQGQKRCWNAVITSHQRWKEGRKRETERARGQFDGIICSLHGVAFVTYFNNVSFLAGCTWLSADTCSWRWGWRGWHRFNCALELRPSKLVNCEFFTAIFFLLM